MARNDLLFAIFSGYLQEIRKADGAREDTDSHVAQFDLLLLRIPSVRHCQETIVYFAGFGFWGPARHFHRFDYSAFRESVFGQCQKLTASFP
jgi:hypothetical protein